MSSWLVGIPTYRRPKQLECALWSLVNQIDAPSFMVLVVDNDPLCSAREVIASFDGLLDIRYMTEGRPGVSHVRNRILDYGQQFELLVFLDDDQIACDRWLFELSEAVRWFPESIVAGSTVLRPDSNLSSALAEVAFSTPSRVAGEVLPTVGTGNSLIPIAGLSSQAARIRFDDRYSFIGGEDTKYFAELVRHGAEIRAWPAAEVLEPVPQSRLGRRDIRERFIRSGHVSAVATLESQTRLRVLVGYMLRVTAGCALSALWMFPKVHLRGRVMLLSSKGWRRALLNQQVRYYGGS